MVDLGGHVEYISLVGQLPVLKRNWEYFIAVESQDLQRDRNKSLSEFMKGMRKFNLTKRYHLK